MIEITGFKKETLTAVTIRPFAWFSWPMQIFQTIKLAILDMTIFATTGKTVQVTILSGTWNAKEILVKAGGLKDLSKQIAIRHGGRLTPLKTVTRYESAEDFKKVSSV